MSADLFGKMRQSVDEYNHKGECRLKLCLEITLYYDDGFLENADGIVHFYRKSLEAIRDHVKYFLVNEEGRFERIKKDTLEMLPFWASEAALDRDIYGLALESGAAADEVSDRAFTTYSDKRDPGWVRLCLPLEFIEQGVKPFVDFAKSATEKLRFKSGHAGYGVNMHRNYIASRKGQRVYMLSRRYRGIDLGRPLFFSGYLEKAIKCVNWLTFLGDEFVDRLGGVEALRTKFSKEIVLHTLPYGVIIQAGPEPDFGDVNRGEMLPHYHEVGRVQTPIRIPEDMLGPYDGIGGTENTREWLARFDE